MTVRTIKRDLRDKILDALENGEELTKKELRAFVKRRTNSLSFDNLRAFAVSRMVSECVGQIKASHRKGWQVNDRDVTDMPHNVDGSVVPEAVTAEDQAVTIIRRNEVSLHGRMRAHAELVKRFERQHSLTADAVRRRKKLETYIRNL